MSSPTGKEDILDLHDVFDDDRYAATEQERSLAQRYGLMLAGVGTFLFLGGVVALSGHDDQPPPRQLHELTVFKILPPPPPPPPQQQTPEQKMIEQERMDTPEFKEEKPLDEPKNEPIKDAKADEPPGPLSLDAKAQGPGDQFNLGGKPGGSAYGLGGGGGGGTRWGWYASIVQKQLESALHANRRTRNASMQVQIRIWADGSGRVTRVQLASSTGDAELDAVIRDEVFASFVLREAPPKDMPMPLVTRVTARRPG